jgi:hypothetical protein
MHIYAYDAYIIRRKINAITKVVAYYDYDSNQVDSIPKQKRGFVSYVSIVFDT